MKEYRAIEKCRICEREGPFKAIVSLGLQPLANRLVTEEEREKAKKYPLQLLFCSRCWLGQLSIVVNPRILYGSSYPFIAGISESWRRHCEDVARGFDCRQKRVIDIGGNDGTLTREFEKEGARTVSVDPSASLKVTKGSFIRGVWNAETAKRAEVILRGKADIIVATNVLGHVEDPISFVRLVKTTLVDGGIFYIEVPSLSSLLQKSLYDTIYHEHLSYFSYEALVSLFYRAGMRIVDIAELDIHGGSYGITAVSLDARARGREGFRARFALPKELVFSFRERMEQQAVKLNLTLERLVAEGKRIYGYGASAKATVRLNFNEGSWAKHIMGVFDDCERKQGLYIPGVGIPILNPKQISAVNPDYVLLFSHNVSNDLRESAKRNGFEGKFLEVI